MFKQYLLTFFSSLSLERSFILFLAFYHSILYCGESQEELFRDLMIVDYWNKQLNDRLPVTYNLYLQGGYINMPSARMGEDGEFGMGYSSVPPYHNLNARFQLLGFLELSGSYRVFKGVEDPILTRHGFGNFADKGANIKFSIFSPEASEYRLPGIAVGIDDIIGTKAFHSKYIVLTQVFLEASLEASFGFGTNRMNKWFGGLLWFPFRKSEFPLLQTLCFVGEYDNIDYKRKDPHPKGRTQKNHWNYGLKYRLWDCLDISAASIRGNRLALSASAYYNFGSSSGLLPKIDNHLPYMAPINNQPLGAIRMEDAMVQEFYHAFLDQGIDLLKVDLSYGEEGNKILRLEIYNLKYRDECEVRDRLNHLLACLTPSDISEVVVVMTSEGFPVQEYRYQTEYLRSYINKKMGEFELNLLTPRCEAIILSPYQSQTLFDHRRDWFNFELQPKIKTAFGSSRGKFKYAVGLQACMNGFLPYDIYYCTRIAKICFSKLGDCGTVDKINPSQLLNVHSDLLRYYQVNRVTIDTAYLQKNWNLGKSWYTRIALGYFDQQYGGATSEWLYYPADSRFAVGIEGSILKKRNPKGIGFEKKIRRFRGVTPTYHRFTGRQYFLDLYYDWEELSLDLRLSVGQFLARDCGVRYEISRYFPSGLKVLLWYTQTNGRDRINCKTYHDKGIEFTMPIDIFYTYSSRSNWNYGMAAWLRDVGYREPIGDGLYDLIHDLRD